MKLIAITAVLLMNWSAMASDSASQVQAETGLLHIQPVEGGVSISLGSKSLTRKIFTFNSVEAAAIAPQVDENAEIISWNDGMAVLFHETEQAFVFALTGSKVEPDTWVPAGYRVMSFTSGTSLHRRSFGKQTGLTVTPTEIKHADPGDGGPGSGCSTSCSISCGGGSSCNCVAGAGFCCSCSCSSGSGASCGTSVGH